MANTSEYQMQHYGQLFCGVAIWRNKNRYSYYENGK